MTYLALLQQDSLYIVYSQYNLILNHVLQHFNLQSCIMSQVQGTSGQSSADTQVQSEQNVTRRSHMKGTRSSLCFKYIADLHATATTPPDKGMQTDTLEAGSQPKVAATPYSAMQFPLTNWPQGWKRRPRSPGLRWYKNYDTPESLKRGRVLVIDYIRQGMWLLSEYGQSVSRDNGGRGLGLSTYDLQTLAERVCERSLLRKSIQSKACEDYILT